MHFLQPPLRLRATNAVDLQAVVALKLLDRGQEPLVRFFVPVFERPAR
jgi:hypothetical protein